MGEWPSVAFSHVPEIEGARELALDVRRAILPRRHEHAPLRSLREVCKVGGFRVRLGDLRVADGGSEAVLLVRSDGGFQIVVDPKPRYGWNGLNALLRLEVIRQRVRFRVGHEVAHSFFYSRDPNDRHRLRTVSDREERFCDEFARALLVPPAVARALPPHGRSVAILQRRFGVSVEVAARALAAAHGGSVVAVAYWPQDVLQTPESLQLQWLSRNGRQVAAQVLARLRAVAPRITESACALLPPSSADVRAQLLPWPRRQIAAVLADVG